MSEFELASLAVARIVGYEVSQCIVDHAFSLSLLREAHESAVLRVEGEFRLSLEGEWNLGPGDSVGKSYAPALGLLFRTIESASLDPTGSLHIGFSGGASLLAYPGDHYESWTLNLPGDTLVVSGVAGDVSFFPPGDQRIRYGHPNL